MIKKKITTLKFELMTKLKFTVVILAVPLFPTSSNILPILHHLPRDCPPWACNMASGNKKAGLTMVGYILSEII